VVASWAAVLAATGFHYSAVTGEMRFAASNRPKSTTFWSTGDAWGTVTQTRSRGGTTFEIRVLHGQLPRLSRVTITGAGSADLPVAGPLNEGQAARVTMTGQSAKPTKRRAAARA
jgi:non-lysosomal glucosylceramidase